MQKKIDIGKIAKISIVWNVKPTDYTKEGENNIKALFAKKYDVPESNIVVDKKFITTVVNGDDKLNSENVKNITDPAFQHKLFKEYLTENEITEYNFDELLKIDSTVNALIDYNQYLTAFDFLL